MVQIPTDAGIRMRLDSEASLQPPVRQLQGVPTDLPELQKGQTFSARIQEVLPDGTYKALVAGKQLTLQLPEGAKSGDMLELVVVDRSPKAVIARLKEGGSPSSTASETGPYPFAKFSPAARMIGELLSPEGKMPPAAQLNRGQPLLAQPPQAQNAAAMLAPTLAKAVTQSGLFYESHQAQWVTGQRPLEQLLQEPQGQRSAPGAFQRAAAEVAAKAISTQERPVTPNSILQALQAAPEKVGAGRTAAETSQSAPAPATTQSQQVPGELRPLVQQQLDAAATQRMFWHGEVWPQQRLDWEIERDTERDADGSVEEEMRWHTTLSLTTPRLGRVDARLQLAADGVRITLATPYGASAGDMRAAAPQLAEALAAAGVPLQGLQVKHEEELAAASASPGTETE